jgi:hypothetical protein
MGNDDNGRRIMDLLDELLGDKVQDMFASYPLYKDRMTSWKIGRKFYNSGNIWILFCVFAIK